MANNKLQELCRRYLSMLKDIATNHGLGGWIKSIIDDNKNGKCVATEQEVEMLSRCVNDERVERKEIPIILNKSYRQCVDNDDFDNIKKLPRLGIYSKVNAIMYSLKRK